MRIATLRITSFAGIAERTMTFRPGLNVILGPNEAGKSTIFHSIEHVCLTPTHLTPTRFKKTMGEYLPVGGGDTLMVSAGFSASDGDYELLKRWGAARGAELKLPDGSLVSDDSAIEERLLRLLPASPAVMKTVLMTYQSGLERTIAQLESDGEPLFDLREVLRRSMQGADGIPVDRFKAALTERIETHFRRWDLRTDSPEQGRGTANPWRQNRGSIVDAWYGMTELEERRDEILGAEDELAKVAAGLSAATRGLDEAEGFLRKHKSAADASAAQEQHALRLEKAHNSETRLAAVYDQWPRATDRLAEVTSLLEAGRNGSEALRKEREAALAARAVSEGQKEARFRLAKAQEYTHDLAVAKEALSTLPQVTVEYADAVIQLQREAENLKRELQSGSVHLRFTAGTEMQLEVRRNLDMPEQIVAPKDEPVSFHAEGSLSVRHADWHLNAQTGERDLEALTAKYDDLSKTLAEELGRFDLVSVDEAKSRHATLSKALDNVAMRQRLLSEVLGDDTIDDLEGEIAPDSGGVTGRSFEVIVEELAAVKQEVTSMENELSQLTTHVKELESTYGDRDKVLDLLLGSRKERKDLEQAIADAPGLPEGYADWKQFRATYVEHQSRRELLLANKHDLETNVASLEAGLPDESAEEVILELEEATRRYTAVRDEGAALKRILEKTGTLLSDTGDIVTRGLKSSFEAYFSNVTGNRYDESEFENDLPTGVLRADGSILAYHQLSAGTKDGLSLALRLAMAEHFLESRSGFLILDDPLVDMDGERRIAASAAIQRFSENLQTIMFTCHPEHAALFPAPAIIRLD